MSIVGRGLGDKGPIVTDGLGLDGGGIIILPESIVSGEVFGVPRIAIFVPGTIEYVRRRIFPKSIVSREKFGKPRVSVREKIGTVHIEDVIGERVEILPYPYIVDGGAGEDEELVNILAELI
jgi:hypothetical protein